MSTMKQPEQPGKFSRTVKRVGKEIAYAARHPITYVKLCTIGGGLYLAQTQAANGQDLMLGSTPLKPATEQVSSADSASAFKFGGSVGALEAKSALGGKQNFTELDANASWKMGKGHELNANVQALLPQSNEATLPNGADTVTGGQRIEAKLGYKYTPTNNKKSLVELETIFNVANNPHVQRYGDSGTSIKAIGKATAYGTARGVPVGIGGSVESGYERYNGRNGGKLVLSGLIGVRDIGPVSFIGFDGGSFVIGTEYAIKQNASLYGYHMPLENRLFYTANVVTNWLGQTVGLEFSAKAGSQYTAMDVFIKVAMEDAGQLGLGASFLNASTKVTGVNLNGAKLNITYTP